MGQLCQKPADSLLPMRDHWKGVAAFGREVRATSVTCALSALRAMNGAGGVLISTGERGRHHDDLAAGSRQRLKHSRLLGPLQFKDGANHRLDAAIGQAREHVAMDAGDHSGRGVKNHGPTDVCLLHHEISGLDLHRAAAAHHNDAPALGHHREVAA